MFALLPSPSGKDSETKVVTFRFHQMLGCEVTHNSDVLLIYLFLLIIGCRMGFICKLTNLYLNIPLIYIVQ